MSTGGVSLEELLWAAHEFQTTVRPSAARQTLLMNERLLQVLRESRSSVRVLLEDKLAPKLNATRLVPAAPVTVTAKELAGAKLTFASLLAKDATLTPKALVLSGVVASFAHAEMLGAATWVELVELGCLPRYVKKWVQQKHSAEVWSRDFLAAKPFTLGMWAKCRQRLQPRDLASLDFNLGVQLTARPQAWAATLRDTPGQWLHNATREEWLQSRQLTAEQYDVVAAVAAPPPQQQRRSVAAPVIEVNPEENVNAKGEWDGLLQ